MKPARARQLVEYLQTSYRISIRRACGVVCFDRSTYHYKHRRPEQASLRKRIRELCLEYEETLDEPASLPK